MALTQVKTTGIADDAVTLAKQAAGTDGQIITYDASGNPTAVGPGTDGQVLTSTGAGSPPAFETLPTSGATLSGSTDNTVVTVTGSNAMAGEANLTFDGGTLQQAIDASDEGYTILADGNHRPTIVGDRDAAGEHDELLHLVGKWNNTQVGAIDIQAGADTSNKDDGHIIFYTSSSGGSLNNRMKIHNDGTVAITDGDLKIATASHGIDFSATSDATDMSSELFDDYEEGTWDVVVTGAESGATSTYSDTGWYTKVGRVVHCHVKLHNVTFPALGGRLDLSAPFAANSSIIARGGPAYWEPTSVWDDYDDMVGIQAVIAQSANQFYLDVMRKDQVHTSQSAGSGGRNGNLSEASGVYLQFTITYFT